MVALFYLYEIVTKYINTTINMVLYLEKDMKFADELQFVSHCEIMEGGLSAMGLKVLAPDVGGRGEWRHLVESETSACVLCKF